MSATWLSESARGLKSDDASSVMAADRFLMTYGCLETQKAQGHFPVTLIFSLIFSLLIGKSSVDLFIFVCGARKVSSVV